MCLVNYAHVGDLTISFHIMSIFVPAPLVLFVFFLTDKNLLYEWKPVDRGGHAKRKVKEQPTDG